MPPSRKSTIDPEPIHHAVPADALPAGYAAILLRVLAVSGYGLWICLGAGLALGMNRIGNGPMQMPLILGTVLVCAGLALGAFRLAAGTEWYGSPGFERGWPTRAAWMALACFVPVALLLLLGDGHGRVLEMRLAGVALLLSSLTSLVHSAYRFRRRLSPGLRRMSSTLPASRLVTACYGGGLWAWLCIMVQGGSESGPGSSSGILLLLALALLLGLLEGMRWQSLGLAQGSDHDMYMQHLSARRVLAAILVYVVPCAALLLTDRFGGGLLAAALAVPSCLLGKTLEQHVYETALRRGFPMAG